MTYRALPFAPPPGTPLVAVDSLGDCQGFTFGAGKSAFRMVVVRVGEEVRGYVNRCPHLSLPLDYRPGQFLTSDGQHLFCSMHYAVFRKDDGLCIDGACEGAALQPVPVEVREGVVTVA